MIQAKNTITVLVFRRKMMISLILIIIVMFTGISGLMLIEDYSLADAFYMTIITMSTVGYGETVPLSPDGKLFIALFIMGSLISFTYAFTSLYSFLLEGEARAVLRNFRMQQKINRLRNHVVVCGYGRIGKQVCFELSLEKQPFVVIEKNEQLLYGLEHSDLLFIGGEATDESVLMQAGIKHAHSLITTLPNDSDNVYVVLTARELNTSLQIISRVQSDRSESKLKRAGCDFTIMPERLGGSHMASIVTKPDILKFLQVLTAPGSTDLYFGELECNGGFSGRKIKDLSLRLELGVTIIGIQLPNGEYVINPGPDVQLESQTKLIVLGNKEQINKFNRSIKTEYLRRTFPIEFRLSTRKSKS